VTATIAGPDEEVAVVPDDIEVVTPAPASRPARAQAWIHAHGLGVAIAGAGTFAGAIVFLVWFRTGAYYARGDLAPFVRTSLSSEFGWQWTHQNTGAGGPNYELVRGVELVFIGIAHLLGGGDALGERLLFAAIFGFAASGVAALVARFVTRPWLVALAGVIGAFSPLTMVNLPNMLVPLAIGCITWSGALAIDAAGIVRPARPRLLAAISLALAYVALNPPLLVLAIGWLALLPFTAALLTGTGVGGIRRGAAFLVRTAVWAVPLALWWLVPYVFAIHSASNSGTINANTNVFLWSWTHAHGSLDRVLALVAKWSWPDPKFGANGSIMARPQLLWLAFALPAGLLAAPIVVRAARRRVALYVLACALGLAFIAKGLNAPLRPANAWIYTHVPGMFLLREPMSKVGIFLMPAVLLGWAFTVDALTRARSWMKRTAWIALILAPVVFAVPMLTGAVVQHSDRVRVPVAWQQVANVVDDSPLQGKALVLPLDDFYQVPTTWGFYGSDSLPVELMHRPTITRNPQRYIGDSDNFEQLVEAVQAALIGGEPDTVPGALRALGVSHLVVRKDIDYASSIRTVQMARPEPLIAALGTVPGIRPVASTSVANVYEFTTQSQPVTALSGTIAAPGAQGEALASLVAAAPDRTAVVTTDRAEAPFVRGQAWYVDVNEKAAVAPAAAGDWTYRWHSSVAPLVEVERTARGLELRPPATVRVAGRALPGRAPVVVTTGAPVTAATVGDDLVDLTSGRSYARVAPGSIVQPYTNGATNKVNGWSALGDCNRYDAQTPSMHSSLTPSAGGDTLIKLRTDRHSACVSADVGAVRGGDLVRIRLDQRAVSGAAPRSCLWQSALQNCASLSWSAVRHGDWYALSAIYRVPLGAGPIRMFLYADEPAPGTATTSEAWYRGVAVSTLTAGAARRIDLVDEPSGHLHLAAGPVAVATAFDAPQPSVGARGDAGDCARSADGSLDHLGIRAEPYRAGDPTSVRLSAHRDSGCVAMPVFGLQPEVTYELSFDATVERGAPPRVCLWEENAQKCAPFDPVQTANDAGGTYRYRGRIDPQAASRKLFVYADAVDGPTTIDYAAVHFQPIADDALVLMPAHVAAPAVPQMTWQSDGPARYHVHVQDARGPFLLALADAFSTNWRVGGLPVGTHARQVEIDGYRNGWAIDARGDLNLTIEYAPARYGRAALRVSQLAAIAFAASFLVGWWWRRRRKRRAGRRDPAEAEDILRRLQRALEIAERGGSPASANLATAFPAGPRRVPLLDTGLDSRG
jgi:arabinofuranan 3-O-arabinosyltransferase